MILKFFQTVDSALQAEIDQSSYMHSWIVTKIQFVFAIPSQLRLGNLHSNVDLCMSNSSFIKEQKCFLEISIAFMISLALNSDDHWFTVANDKIEPHK